MSEEEIKGPGFVVKDKRHSKKSEDEIKEEETTAAAEETADKADSDEPDLRDVPIDFSTFVLSLTSSAFYNLGDIADPHTGEKKVDLTAVKQTIEILLILKEKTKGNLSEEETKLLEQLIYELQMKFVAAEK